MYDSLLQGSRSFLALSISDGDVNCLSSRQDTASPTDTACSSESPAFLGPASHLLAYDQNSSEEELEVINGGASSVVDSETDGDGGGGGGSANSVIGLDCAASGVSTGSSESVHRVGGSGLLMSLADVGYQNACDDELDDCAEELCLATSSAAAAGRLRPLTVTPTQLASGSSAKRCSSNNLLEKRKRSLAHSSDDEVRHLLENQHQQHHHPHHHQPLMSAPVNFRTSPPLEALKPHRGHIIQRSTTPLILTESGRGLEHIRISSSSSISSTTSSLSSLGGAIYGAAVGGPLPPTCDSPTSNSSHHHHHHHHQQTSNNLALLSTTMAGVQETNQMEISRSVSPPAKVFHCAVSPRRRQPSSSSSSSRQQRLQRPHRPCLDFDKMQQLKARSVTTWRHSNEHSGELSVFCW